MNLDLGEGIYLITRYPEWVQTEFPDKLKAWVPLEKSYQNIEAAREMGYEGDNCVWRALVDSQILHTLVARQLFHRFSYCLRAECEEESRLALQLHEKALVQSLQYAINTNLLDFVWDCSISLVYAAQQIQRQFKSLPIDYEIPIVSVV